MNMYSFSVLLPFNFTSNQTMEVSPDSSASLFNDTFVVTLQSDVFYNITVHSLNQKWVYEIGKGYIYITIYKLFITYALGPCPLLSSSPSYRVLYYNLSSSGLQTVSVLRCDWEGEVVVMECTQNGDWKSINQQLDMCSKDKEVSLIGNISCSVLDNGLINNNV